jgi:tetratricopeptide (TPR) repeat protein
MSYAHSNLGSIYIQLGDYLKAENEFKSGIRANSSLPTNHFNLGSLLASQGRNLEAKKFYEKAEGLYKNHWWGYQIPLEFYINKARLLLKLGLYGDAESSIRNYLGMMPCLCKTIPKSGLGHFVLADIFAATGKYKQALHEYNQVGNEPKLKAKSHNNRALIFIKQKSFNRALEELHQATTISPNLIDAHYNLGNLLIQTNGDPIKSRRHLEKALKLSTNNEGTDRIKRTLSALP